MTDNAFDPRRKYDAGRSYDITGAALNQIGAEIVDLKQKVKDLKADNVQEELTALRIRDKNPTVKDAWDNYQTVLALVSK